MAKTTWLQVTNSKTRIKVNFQNKRRFRINSTLKDKESDSNRLVLSSRVFLIRPQQGSRINLPFIKKTYANTSLPGIATEDLNATFLIFLRTFHASIFTELDFVRKESSANLVIR